MTYRNTRQRQMVLDCICQSEKGKHPTADWVYGKLRAEDPKISLGTVYRNLDILCKQGIIRKIKSGSAVECYDRNPMPHYHFYCSHCNEVFDVDDFAYDEGLDEAMRKNGHHVSSHRLIFDGHCKQCAQNAGVDKITYESEADKWN